VIEKMGNRIVKGMIAVLLASMITISMVTVVSSTLSVTPIVTPVHSTTNQSMDDKANITISSYTELFYDDGEIDNGWATGPLGGGAVLFTPPSTPWTLSKVKVMAWYTLDDAPFYIEIWDSEQSELFQGTYMYSDYFSSVVRWAEIDIPDITITGDFYVCVFPNDGGKEHRLWLGFDVDPQISNRSYAVTYPDNSIDYAENWNWMIRAIGSSEPTVSISTDRFEYSPDDILKITIDIANPTEESVTFQHGFLHAHFA